MYEASGNNGRGLAPILRVGFKGDCGTGTRGEGGGGEEERPEPCRPCKAASPKRPRPLIRVDSHDRLEDYPHHTTHHSLPAQPEAFAIFRFAT